jgi:hypothetical protein
LSNLKSRIASTPSHLIARAIQVETSLLVL